MGQVKIKISEKEKNKLFSNLENSLCEMNVEAFSKVFCHQFFLVQKYQIILIKGMIQNKLI